MPQHHDFEDVSGDDNFDENDEVGRTFKRMVVAGMSGPVMKRYAAAAALLLTGKRGHELHAPEPLVQVGFEPTDADMPLLVAIAREAGRDLIHVSCHDDGSGKPTGMIAVVYLDAGAAHPHRRAGLLCAPGAEEVFLAGVSDNEDENCHFILSSGKKMVRASGHLVDDLGAAMNRGGERWIRCADALEHTDCSDEILRIPTVLQGPGAPTPVV